MNFALAERGGIRTPSFQETSLYREFVTIAFTTASFQNLQVKRHEVPRSSRKRKKWRKTLACSSPIPFLPRPGGCVRFRPREEHLRLDFGPPVIRTVAARPPKEDLLLNFIIGRPETYNSCYTVSKVSRH